MSTIVIDHLARVEGTGHHVEMEGDAVKDVRFDVFEGAAPARGPGARAPLR